MSDQQQGPVGQRHASMTELRALIERAVCRGVPHGAALILARLGRSYIQRSNLHFGKGAIARGRSVFGICHWHRLHTTAVTEFGTRYKIQFPDKIQRYIFYFGVWEPAITAFIRGSLAPGDKFVDVGANIGYHTCLAAKLVGPSGAVYAIEASPSIYEVLLENVDLNELGNVHAYNNAVFDKQETLRLFKGKDTNIGRANLLKERPGGNIEEVNALPLHQLIDLETLFNVRLVKIDVEGAEWFVIKGISEHLKYFSPSTEWLVEVNKSALREHGADFDQFVDLFTAAGYNMYAIDNRYDADWYVRHRRRYLGQPVENLVHAPPSSKKSQFDALFSKRPYGRTDARPERSAAPGGACGPGLAEGARPTRRPA
jgi:FkbM family methyltransferase